MTRRKKHILVVESRPEDAQMMRNAFAAVPECGECIVCRNPSEVRAYLSGAGAYSDRTSYPLPDAVLFSLESVEDANLELLQWIGRNTTARVVVLFEGQVVPKQDLPITNPIALKKPQDVDGVKRVLKEVAKLLCSPSGE